MTGSRSDDGPLSDIPPADQRKSLVEFLVPRPSRPPSLAEFLKPPKSVHPKGGRLRESVVPPANDPAPPADQPASIEIPNVEPPLRPSLFAELPVPRTSPSLIPRPAKTPAEGDEFHGPRERSAPGKPDNGEDRDAAKVEPPRLGVTDDAELDAEMTSTRRWVEARRSAPGAVGVSAAGLRTKVTGELRSTGADSPLRHTAEPVWKASEREHAAIDDHAEPGVGVAQPAPWRTPAGRGALAVAIVGGAAVLTLLIRSSSGRLPAVQDTAAGATAMAEQAPGTPTPVPLPGDPPPAPAEANAESLRREARELLAAGKAEEGVRLARQVLALNPQDSEAYILLAAGLQDLGKWRESQEIFQNCVNRGKGATTDECLYFARRAQ